MIGKYRPDKVVVSDVFVREPVDEICKKIEESSSKKIILTGGREIGKTVILNHEERRGLITPHRNILMRFDSAGMGIGSDLYNDKFLSHYYEIIFSIHLLSYIKKYYGIIYSSDVFYSTMLDEINKLALSTDKYMRNYYYVESKIPRVLFSGELVEPILKKFREDAKIDSFSLSLDRFEWTNAGKEIVQKILSRYFDMFDKAVITVDDETIDKDILKKKEFDIIESSYNKDIDVVKEIVRRYSLSDNNMEELFKKAPNDLYQALIDGTHGNLDNILLAFTNVSSSLSWDPNTDIIDAALKSAKYYDKEFEEQKKMSAPKKFYL